MTLRDSGQTDSAVLHATTQNDAALNFAREYVFFRETFDIGLVPQTQFS